LVSRFFQYYTNLLLYKKLILFILLISILISAFQFFYNRSLWLDEAMLANNIIHRDLAGLLLPLDYKQIAPIFFLILEKIFSVLIPDSELGLRLLPLLCFWLSCFYFYKTLKIIFSQDSTVILALSVFAFNALLIYFSNEVKQYSTDVMVCIILYYILLRKYKKIQYRYLNLAISGSLAILTSSITPILLLTIGIYLISESKIKTKDQLIKLAGLFLLWMLIFLLYFFLFIYNHPAKEFMVNYWGKAHAFMPKNPINPAFYKFILHYVFIKLISLLNFYKFIKLLIGIFTLTGLINIIFISKNKIAILLICPLFIHLILSAFEIYPFDIRFILYFIPFFTILSAFGFEIMIQKLNHKSIIQKLIVIGLPIILLFNLLIYLPMQREEIKKSLSFLKQNIKKGDKIYIYFATESAFQYYNSIHYFNYPVTDVIIGKSNWNAETDLYPDDLKNLRGNCWLIFTHIHDDDELKLQYKLTTDGNRPFNQLLSKGSSIYLFKFKN
jgi:uncharacterized membrane protein